MASPKFHSMSDSERLNQLHTLGLGTGVDMTDQEPWRARNSYQVCHIKETMDNVLVVDEGGNWHNHVNVDTSRQEMQNVVKMGISTPDTPFTIKADAEYSRTKNFPRTTCGRRLVDCKVSICPDNLEGDGTPNSFEKRLSDWVLTKFRHYANTAKAIQEKLGLHRVEDLLHRRYENNELDSLNLDEAEKQLLVATHGHQALVRDAQNIQWKPLVELCLRFIKSFRVTHFVRTVELGVLEYQVVEENKRSGKKGGSADIDVSSLATASASSTLYWKQFSMSMRTRRVGALEDDGKEIQRLAVLSVDVYPITNLVTSPYLKLGLQKALSDYVDERQAEEDNEYRRGPFLITFEDEDEFYGLKVSETCTLEATDKKEEASPFFLGPLNSLCKDEFYIVYYGQKLMNVKGHFIAPNTETRIPYYLKGDISMFGNNSGPLRFKPNTDSEAAEYKFKFEVPMNEEHSTQLIIKGEKLFYICCQRKWKMDSYIVLTKSGEKSNGFTFHSGCTHSKAEHNQDTRFMLFRLQKFKPMDSTNPTDTASSCGLTSDL